MRILELELRAVGPFDDFSLDLSAGDKGLHFIYGPNEAGKSSALRALPYLFFGFPPQLDDPHPYSSLRVGARICNDQNESLEFLRRKAAKNSLRAFDDATLVLDEALRRFLGHIDQSLFKTFFGIDHSMLVRGGQAIVEGQGDVGKILFSGSGVSELHTVLKNLDAEMEALFLPGSRAKKPRLNDHLSKLDAARNAIRDKRLSQRDWDEQRKALERDLRRKQKAEEDLQQFSRERNGLQRVLESLPFITKRADLLARRAELAPVPTLPPDFRERRQKVEQSLRLADADRTRATAAVGSINEQLKALDIPETFLNERDAIEPISRRLGVYQQAQDDRPALDAERRRLEEDALQTLHKIDKSLELADAGSVQLPETERNRIRALGGRYDALAKQLDQSNARVSDLLTEAEDTRKRLDALPEEPDATSLRTVLKQAITLGDIEHQLAALRDEHQAADEELAINFRQLSLWSGTRAELETLSYPTTETIERFDTELAEVEQELRDVRRDIQSCQETAEDLDRKIRHLRLEQDVPTEGNLNIARRRRDEGWVLVRRAWRDGEPVDDEIRMFLESVGKGREDLAAGFEQTIEQADDIADRLRREASRVATLSELQAQREACEERITRLTEHLGETKSRRQILLQEWSRVWERAGIAPLLPREMLAWTRQYSQLAQQAKNVRLLYNDIQRLKQRLVEQWDKLSNEIEGISHESIDSNISLVALINKAELLLSSIGKVAESRKELARDLERLEGELDRGRQAAAKSQRDHDEWQNQWADATRGLPLKPGHGPAEATVLLDLVASFSQQIRDASSLRTRIGQIDQSNAQFVTYISDLTARLSTDLTSLPADQAAAELYARFQRATKADGQRDILKDQLDSERESLRNAATTIDDMQRELSALCAEAQCSSADQLPETERRSEEKQRTDSEIESTEAQLRSLSAGQSLSDFVAQAQSLDADTIEPRIYQLDGEIEELNRELKNELGERIGATRTVLKQMDCSAGAAEAAEEAQDLAARIASDAEEYARLKLAYVILGKAIERYREAHQVPILQRASQLFSDLTVGSFSGLREDFDDNGDPELFVVRAATNQPVKVKHMSDGAADQLYLAVRLAWLENFLSKHEAIPFIVDDVLIRFDDDRAVATLKALAKLSSQTQILFFTHHRHLLNRAREVLDDDTFFMHELPGFPSLQRVV